nr:putative capsid protein [Picobirnavirus sp.]
MEQEITNERERMEEKDYKSNSRKSNKKGSKRGKSRGKRSKHDNNRSKAEVDSKFKDTDNDVSWYASNQEILKASANFSYFNPVGNKLSWESQVRNTKITFGSNMDYVPGIMTIPWIGVPGIATSYQSAVNVAADNIYSYVRYQNSGAKNYEAPDLMLYLLAMDELYCWWARAVRAYGTIRVYSQTNRYLPKALLLAQGFNPEDVIGKEAEFRGKINALAAQISAFCVPATLPYFARHFWMNTNIYTDNDVFKPQIYIYKQIAYRTYEETESEDGGMLHTHSVPHYNDGEGMTINEWYNIAITMLRKVTASEDIGIMSGDILKAFGRENLFKLNAIDESYAVIPTYNQEVLNQIHNAELNVVFTPDEPVENGANDTTLVRTFDIKHFVSPNNILSCNPVIPTNVPLEAPHVLNFHNNDITPEMAMVATRLKSHFMATNVLNSNNKLQWTCTSAGSEVCFAAEIWFPYLPSTHGFTFYYIQEFETAASIVSEVNISSLINFDWHPLVYQYQITGGEGTTNIAWTVDDYIYDMANYTMFGYEQLDQTHQCAILSEFKIPVLGSF